MEKARGSTAMVSSKIVMELEIAKYQMTNFLFCLMFHIAERLLYINIFV